MDRHLGPFRSGQHEIAAHGQKFRYLLAITTGYLSCLAEAVQRFQPPTGGGQRSTVDRPLGPRAPPSSLGHLTLADERRSLLKLGRMSTAAAGVLWRDFTQRSRMRKASWTSPSTASATSMMFPLPYRQTCPLRHSPHLPSHQLGGNRLSITGGPLTGGGHYIPPRRPTDGAPLVPSSPFIPGANPPGGTQHAASQPPPAPAVLPVGLWIGRGPGLSLLAFPCALEGML